MRRPFEGMDWTDFWADDDDTRETYVCEPPTDELIASVEAELGRRFMMEEWGYPPIAWPSATVRLRGTT